jgi:hypothetical protein
MSPVVDLSLGSLFASLLIGSVGLVLFVYGKRQERLPQLIVGVILMVYPYFVGDVVWMSAIAVVLLVGLKLALRNGL